MYNNYLIRLNIAGAILFIIFIKQFFLLLFNLLYEIHFYYTELYFTNL